MKSIRYSFPLLLAAVFALGMAVGDVAAQPARPVATTVATGPWRRRRTP